MKANEIDLTKIPEFKPGNIINFKYFEYDGRQKFIAQEWSIEATYKHFLFCSRYVKNGVIIKECFNTATLIERGVIVEKEVL